MPPGQVYSTLGRLTRDELVILDGEEAGQGPDRKRYSVTESGIAAFEAWLGDADAPLASSAIGCYPHLIMALRSGREVDEMLDHRRTACQDELRRLTREQDRLDVVDGLLIELARFQLEAEIQWLEHTRRTLDRKATS